MEEEVDGTNGLTQWWILLVWSIEFLVIAALFSKVARRLVHRPDKDDNHYIPVFRMQKLAG